MVLKDQILRKEFTEVASDERAYESVAKEIISMRVSLNAPSDVVGHGLMPSVVSLNSKAVGNGASLSALANLVELTVRQKGRADVSNRAFLVKMVREHVDSRSGLSARLGVASSRLASMRRSLRRGGGRLPATLMR